MKNETKLLAGIKREHLLMGWFLYVFAADKIILSQGHYAACIKNKTAVGDVTVC